MHSPEISPYSPPTNPSADVLRSHELIDENSLAYLFPGQGGQSVGMGARLAEYSPAAHHVWEIAREVIGDDFIRICREGPLEELSQTVNTQPAIIMDSLARVAALDEAAQKERESDGEPNFINYVDPKWATGNSLGFYGALVKVGSLTLEDGFRLTRERGKISALASASPSSMMAVVDDDPQTHELLQTKQGLSLCLDNTPRQKVYGGEPQMLEDAKAWLEKERSAQKIIPLKVQGAFHSQYMKDAVPLLAEVLQNTNIVSPKKGRLVGIANVRELITPDEIKQELLDQLVKTVRWIDTIRFLRNQGVNVMAELNEGPTLTQMNSDILEGGKRERVIAPQKEGETTKPPPIIFLWRANQAA